MKRRMKQKSKNAISIIGGADGPTSIFIAGHSKKQPLKIRIKNSIYRYKRKKVEKTIVANPHLLKPYAIVYSFSPVASSKPSH